MGYHNKVNSVTAAEKQIISNLKPNILTVDNAGQNNVPMKLAFTLASLKQAIINWLAPHNP
jgi:hypothetical protein